MKVLMLILWLCLLVWPANAYAECSIYRGKASINEIGYQSAGNFLEVKILDVNITSDIYKGWKVQGCYRGTGNAQDCSGWLDFPSLEPSTFPWIPLATSAIHLGPSGEGMDVLLRDADGKTIDYMYVGSYQPQRDYSCTSSFDDHHPLTNSHHIGRYPDGTGGWGLEGPGGSEDPTPGASNTGEEDPPPPSLHLIRIEHDGAGLTCQAETITIRACADANCLNDYTDEVTVNLTSPASGWSPDPVTFSGGSAIVELRYTSGGTITLDAVAISPSVGNATLCTNSSGGPACEMIFNNVGVLIDGDDSDVDPESHVVTQIAGKPSNVSPPGLALQQRVRVVRTDDQTGACVAGVGNESINAIFQYLVPTLAEGLADNTITVIGTTGANLAAAGSGATVQLAFDSNGTAPFHFVSADAGRYSLRVDIEIPVTDANGDATGETIAVSDTSNQFVIRPLAIFADATANPQSQSAAGDAYKKAGESFPLTFKSLRWTAGRDGNNDGQWDDCGSSALVDPGTPLARVPAWIIGQPAVDLALPAGGINPDVSYADGNVAFVAGETEATANNVFYNEVGIVQLQADGMDTFLGESVAICSPYIGRFTPDHFTTTVLEQGVLEHGCSGFTYSGQPFSYVTGSFPEMLITAHGQGGNQTLNYRDDFVKLTNPAPQIMMLPAVEDVQVGALSAPMKVVWTPENSSLTPNNDGTLNFVLGGDEFVYVKEENALIDKFVSTIRLSVSQITDSDGIGANNMPTHFFPVGTEIRYGRMVLDNAYGPETLPLAIPIRTEYFNGSTFIPNNIDSCTPYASTYALLDDFTSPLSVGDTLVSGAGTLLNGALGTFTLSAPGVGKEGSLVLEYNLGTGGADLPWLQFDWEGDGSRLNPTAKATFGIFKGNPRLIYMRESVW